MATPIDELNNVCCPELEIVPCADTESHKHLVCSYSLAVLTNKTVTDICIKDHYRCLLRKDVQTTSYDDLIP